MKPIIGINCDYEGEGKRPYSFTYRDYSEAIIKAGGIPLLLPLVKDEDNIEFLVDKIDGLLFTGGNDIHPHRYGEKMHKKTVCVHPDKDICDFVLLHAGLQKKKPMLAICYGAQLVNVALGGALIQDIPSEYSTAIIHKDSKNNNYTHSVKIKKDSCLYNIMGRDYIETNSAHHQAIKTLGKGLRDVAHTEDGIIEAIERKDYPFLLGVQWHPERLIDNPCHASLFNALICASK